MFKFFNESDFYGAFITDLENARALVLVQSPFLSHSRIDKMQNIIRKCVRRRIRLCVFVQKPRKHEELVRVQELASRLVSMGVHVNFKEKVHEKMAVIDEEILWDGSLNALSQSESFERMTRWHNRQIVFEAIVKHRLNTCEQCTNQGWSKATIPITDTDNDQLQALGKLIAQRRHNLQMTQRDVAELNGLRQSTVSHIEKGKRGVALVSILQVCNSLDLVLRPVPWYFIPTFDDLFKPND